VNSVRADAEGYIRPVIDEEPRFPSPRHFPHRYGQAVQGPSGEIFLAKLYGTNARSASLVHDRFKGPGRAKGSVGDEVELEINHSGRCR
jgi:hypothetical protein